MRITIGQLRRIIRETVEQMGNENPERSAALRELESALEAKPGRYMVHKYNGDSVSFISRSGGYMPKQFEWDGSAWVEAGRPSASGRVGAPAMVSGDEGADPGYERSVARDFERGGHGTRRADEWWR